MPKYFAGIGTRAIPTEICTLMSQVAKKLSEDGWTLRSGGAAGADSAFEAGATIWTKGQAEIFRPEHATVEAIELASQFHPAWEKCNEWTRYLHGRNVMIALGENLDVPVKFVICWTSNGKDKGGTGLAMRIASHYDIPIFNLYSPSVCIRLRKYVGVL